MQITIREVQISDAKAVTLILNPIIETRAFSVLIQPFSIEAEREFIGQFPPQGIFHVAVADDGTVVGFQTVEPFASYTAAFNHVGIIGSFVGLEYHKKGIGKALFAATFAAARAKGFEKLFAFVRADNAAGLAAYSGQGFKQIGLAKKQAKIDGVYIDEIMIERFL